jgi:hypothetical protein
MKKKALRFIASFGFGLSLILGPLSVQAFDIQQLSRPCHCAMATCCCSRTAGGTTKNKHCCLLKPGPAWNLLANSQEPVQTASTPSTRPTSFQPSLTQSVSRKIRTQESPPGPASNFASIHSGLSPPTA